MMVTDQGEDITQTLKAAAQGKLATKRRPMARKISGTLFRITVFGAQLIDGDLSLWATEL